MKVLILLAVVVLAGCGGKGGSSTGQTTSQGAEFQVDKGGILFGMYWNEQNLMAGSNSSYPKGAHYIIGSCPKDGVSKDDEDNVNSQLFKYDGSLKVGEMRVLSGTLKSRTNFCPGAKYTVYLTRVSDTAVEVDISIDELPAMYAALSLPMDLTAAIFDIFQWPGGSGNYDTVNVVFRVDPTKWIEACSSALNICVRRTILWGDYTDALFYTTNGIHNLEIHLGSFIPAGKTFHFRERIEIRSFN